MDPVSIMGLVMDVVIAALAFAVYDKKKNKTFLYLGISFVVFALSYIMALLGLVAVMAEVHFLVRAVALLLMLFAVYIEFRS
jgi:hypothetical protein